MRPDLGCGYVKEADHVGIDDLRGVASPSGQLSSIEGEPDVLLDLNADAYPFHDASVDAIRSRHFLEHSVLDHVFDESHRILRPGAAFVAILPYANSADGVAPDHHIFITEHWFELNRRFTYRQSEEWEA